MRFVFFGLMVATFVAANIYLYRRLVRDVTQRRALRGLGGAVLGLAFLGVPLLRLAFRSSAAPTGVTVVVMAWWGVTIYTLMALLTAEVARFLLARRTPSTTPEAASGLPTPATPPTVDPGRRQFLARATAAGALAAGGGLTALGSWRAFTPPAITEVPIRLPGLPKALDGFTIVQLSDIHVGAVIQERFLDQLVSTANGAKPDLIAITGDLVDGHPDQLGRFVARLRHLSSRYGTYFVSGNHDYYSGWSTWAPVLETMNMTVLRNRFLTIGEPSASFDLIGVDDYGSR